MNAVTPLTVAALPTPEQVLPQARRENFTVASAILGRRRTRHLMAIYGFARLVDDVGDEAEGDRSALLDLVGLELGRVFAPGGEPQHPLMRELAGTVHECALQLGPFERLIEANRRDQVVARYETFEQLLDYCQLSAAPVGELVLGVFGAATPDRVALSDRVCAGLQVVEHLQDIAEDHARGRVYMPREDIVETSLTPVEGQTFCPYKGLACYYDIGDRKGAAWYYPQAWPEVGRIRNLVSFEPDKIDVFLDDKQLALAPGQNVIPHGIDRGLDPDEMDERGSRPH